MERIPRETLPTRVGPFQQGPPPSVVARKGSLYLLHIPSATRAKSEGGYQPSRLVLWRQDAGGDYAALTTLASGRTANRMAVEAAEAIHAAFGQDLLRHIKRSVTLVLPDDSLPSDEYATCERCGEDQGVAIGGNGDSRGTQWECSACGNVWWG